MGTSTSSSGGKAGSPFDPEWLAPDTSTDSGSENGEGEEQPPNPEDANQSEAPENPPNPELAPKRRYAEARTNMSGYLSGKGSASMKSAMKSMINKGMGGTRRAATSMRNTARGTGALGQFLMAAREGSDPRVVNWVSRVKQVNLSANDLILELIKEVLPETGSVDDESLRNAATNALSQLYEQTPEIDIFSLTDQQIYQIMAITIANEVCNRVDLQLGQTYERLKYNPQQIQEYRNDIQEYIQAEVSVVMERYSDSTMSPQKLASEVLESALEVFAS